jgi:hypothetical protein
MALDVGYHLPLDELPDRVAGHLLLLPNQLIEMIEIEILQ